MNRSPTPGGVFCNQFRGGRWELGSVSQPISWVLREHSPNVRHVIGNPSAAVGADLSCPHIGKYTRNGGRICAFDNGKMRIW